MAKEITETVFLPALIVDLSQRAAGAMRPPGALKSRRSAEGEEIERHTFDPPDTERCHVESNITVNELQKSRQADPQLGRSGDRRIIPLGKAGVTSAGPYARVNRLGFRYLVASSPVRSRRSQLRVRGARAVLLYATVTGTEGAESSLEPTLRASAFRTWAS